MLIVKSVNLEDMELEIDGEPPGPSQLRLVVTDTDDRSYRIAFERSAIIELVKLLRAVQAEFPGALGGH